APYFRWTMVKADWMHAADLGILVYELAESWWSMLPELGDTDRKISRETGLGILKRRLRQHYRDTKCASRLPLKRFGLTKIRARQRHPKLKAKAGQARKLLGFTVDLARECQDKNDAIGAARLQSLECLSEVYDIANKAELQAHELTRWRYLMHLHNYYYAKCGYRFYPKFHYIMHLPQQCEQGGVARSFWVYGEETKNMFVKRLFNICSKGHGLCASMLERLQWQQALRSKIAAR
ncbi:unnamed protein product, partial [Prorocentrum cordatum]